MAKSIKFSEGSKARPRPSSTKVETTIEAMLGSISTPCIRHKSRTRDSSDPIRTAPRVNPARRESWNSATKAPIPAAKASTPPGV
eukprot:scaffold7453_cov177-Amphora_coffeaeformis.AAC.3